LNKPPYGTLTAIDLDTGEQRWQVTVGDRADLRNHPLLRHLQLPPLGVPGPVGGTITKGGLIFIAGGGSTLYALDTRNGSALWSAKLGGASRANPMTYQTSDGRQFVVVATGNGAKSRLMAFTLPAPSTSVQAMR
jgi:quinoprotein glucose dehydrogenase